jgi:hypothetical protein
MKSASRQKIMQAGDDRKSLFLTAVSLEGATCGRPHRHPTFPSIVGATCGRPPSRGLPVGSPAQPTEIRDGGLQPAFQRHLRRPAIQQLLRQRDVRIAAHRIVLGQGPREPTMSRTRVASSAEEAFSRFSRFSRLQVGGGGVDLEEFFLRPATDWSA